MFTDLNKLAVEQGINLQQAQTNTAQVAPPHFFESALPTPSWQITYLHLGGSICRNRSERIEKGRQL